MPRTLPLPTIDPSVWYADGLRFECTQCGNCCSGAPGYVWITEKDMVKIAAYLKMEFDEFTRTYVRRINHGGEARYSLIEKPDYDCVFLTRTGGKAGCSIYPVRPTQCRTWPFWTDVVRSPETWRKTARGGAAGNGGCPGMLDPKARLYDLQHIETCRQNPESP